MKVCTNEELLIVNCVRTTTRLRQFMFGHFRFIRLSASAMGTPAAEPAGIPPVGSFAAAVAFLSSFKYLENFRMELTPSVPALSTARLSASRKSTTISGWLVLWIMIWDTLIWRLECSNHSKTRSAQNCYLCSRYVLLPMCPGWTVKDW